MLNVFKRLIREDAGVLDPLTALALVGGGILLAIGIGVGVEALSGGFADTEQQVYVQQIYEEEEATPQPTEEPTPEPTPIVIEEEVIEEAPDEPAPQPQAPSGGSGGGGHPDPVMIEDAPQ